MKYIIVSFLALFASSAFAVLDDNSTNQSQLQGQAQGQAQGQVLINAPSTRIANDSRAAALAYTASLNNPTAVSGGSTSGVNFNVEYPQQVAAVALGGLYPSAPCMGTSNVGGGNPFFNIAVGTSWESKECQLRETARSFAAVGLSGDAVAILCTSEYAMAAPSCQKKDAQ